MGRQTLAHFSPGRVILSTVLAAIALGTLALSLPAARTKPLAFIDIFFTATSATCVTGLFTIPLSDFTFFGHTILLFLIQIGGLGLITMTLFLLSLFIDLGLATKFMAGELLEVTTWKQIKKLLIFTIGLTLTAELIGMLVFIPHIAPGTNHAWFYALFHAISSFCNAGISLIGTHSLASCSYCLFTRTATALLIFLGGLGFITLHELTRYTQTRLASKPYRLSLHTKIVLYGTLFIVTAGTLLFFILERGNTLAGMHPLRQVTMSLFHVISFRSTGFYTIAPYNFQLATLFLIMIIAFVGSAPGSTGSGIKLTIAALFLATVKAAITGRTSVELRGRTIPKDQVYKAIAVVFLSMAWIGIITFCLLITEQHWSFLDLLFEATSASTNLGLSTDTTATLSSMGKLLITLSMIVGRVGSLTLVLALKIKRKPKGSAEFTFPEERVMLG